MLLQSLPYLILILGVVVAVPAKEKRVHRHSDLSDHAHDDSTGFHYDHEAFLGKEEAKTFDQLTPEESKDKLGYIMLQNSQAGSVPNGQYALLLTRANISYVVYFFRPRSIFPMYISTFDLGP